MSIIAFRRLLLRPVGAALLAGVMAGFVALPGAYAADAAKVKLPVGTVVDLVFDAAVTPTTATVGQNVQLRVVSDVTIDGRKVIAAGTMASGAVTLAQKPGAVGKEGQIGVLVKTVTAVDGTVVPLDGSKVVMGENKQTSSLVITLLCCILGLLQKGGAAEIPAGTAVKATVSAPVEIAAP